MDNQLTTTPSMALAINDAQHQILTQATPTDEVRFRQGKGGRHFPYTDPAYVIRTLNLAFGWDWSFEADNEDIFYVNDRPFEAKVRGRLTVHTGDKTIVKVQYGCQPIEYQKNSPDTPVSLGDAYKGAASDALKKCASLLGVALDLYDSDSDINTGRTPAQPTQRPAAQQSTPQTSKPVVVEHPAKPANGGKVASDPMSQYWYAVRQAGLSETEGKRTLQGTGNDPVKALAAITGISQEVKQAA